MAVIAALVTALVAAVTGLGLVTAAAATGSQRIALRVLVVQAGDPGTQAIMRELDVEGVPYTSVDATAAGRPTIDAAFLEDAATGTAKYQAVVLPNETGAGLTSTELASLAAYEAAYGIRQVIAYTYPGVAVGSGTPAFSGILDGSTATVTAAGRGAAFGYLRGPVAIENADPAIGETFGYLAVPPVSLPAGQTWTSLVDVTVADATGSLAYVWSHDGREELVISASFNQNMQWYNVLAEGVVSWMTRGIHLGYNRNYLAVHIDDILLPDSRWSVDGNCTPGDDCLDPTVTTADIRMTPADVTRLVDWQDARGVSLDMVFNGGGSEAAALELGGTDPLTDALLAQKSKFRWVNHTYSHPFLGCVQIAPTVVGNRWTCATSATQTPRQDPQVVAAPSGGIYWASQAFITDQLQRNHTWATTNALPNYDPAELITGEHSGLATLPQQPVDNPFLAPALAAQGIAYTGSDASREPNQRVLAGGSTATVPRHPMNIFYNAGTFREEVDEYNWIYTSVADGGGGICTANPATSTCITPLPAGNAAEAKASFDSYIVPIEVRNGLRFVLSNDPRPFYAHQSNLAEDGILYPVLDGIIGTYAETFDRATTPLVQTGLAGQYTALQRLSDWTTQTRASGFTDGYVDRTGVHLPASTVPVPLTVPAGSTGTGLSAYGGSLSGWLAGSATVVPPTPAGGWRLTPALSAPTAPGEVTAVPGSTLATVSWTPPASDGGSRVTGYIVRAYVGTSTTPIRSVTATADATTLPVTGLANGISYRFDVAATNAVGAGPASARSAAVTPRAALAPVPTGVTAQVGNGSAQVTWTPPANVTGVTGYRVRAYLGSTPIVARATIVGAGRSVAAITGLTNGRTYTFTVNAVTGIANGVDSARSAAVAPTVRSQTDVAPTISIVTAGDRSVALTWAAAVEAAGSTATGYRVQVFRAGTSTLVRSAVLSSPAARSTTLTGLTNGTAYEVQVNVIVSGANGPTSARSVAVTPTTQTAGALPRPAAG